MANYNKVLLMGNLTRDPDLRYTPKGTAVARLGLAVNRSWRSESGELKEEVTFIDIDAFGKQAETIGNYLRRGSPIFIEGRLKLDSWEDKNTGQKQNKLRVVLESFRFMDSAKNREGAGGASSEGRPQRSAAAPPPPPSASSTQEAGGFEDMPTEDDDVPF